MSIIVIQSEPLKIAEQRFIDSFTDIDMRIEAEQIRHIYSQTPFYVPVVIVGSLLTMIILWPATTPVIAISWCIWIWMIYTGLWVMSRRWKKAKIADDTMHKWALS